MGLPNGGALIGVSVSIAIGGLMLCAGVGYYFFVCRGASGGGKKKATQGWLERILHSAGTVAAIVAAVKAHPQLQISRVLIQKTTLFFIFHSI